MVPIYTTYLARLRQDPKMPERIGSCFVYVVTTRVNANRCVAPDWSFLEKYKEAYENCKYPDKRGKMTFEQCKEEAWSEYEKAYLFKITTNADSVAWMLKRAEEAIIGNILLVCFEKDSNHCHRRLLAERIAQIPAINGKSAEYRGEFLG